MDSVHKVDIVDTVDIVNEVHIVDIDADIHMSVFLHTYIEVDISTTIDRYMLRDMHIHMCR